MRFSNLSKHAQGGLGDARNYGKFNLKVKSEPQGQRNKVITSSQALTTPTRQLTETSEWPCSGDPNSEQPGYNVALFPP